MTKQDATNHLHRAGLRQTQDRLRMLRLLDSRRAWTADQLHAEMPDVDLSTVYRNLNSLTEKGILQNTPIRDGKSTYELADSKHHAHSICRSCGRISCVPCPLKGRSNEDHSLELYRNCGRCRR